MRSVGEKRVSVTGALCARDAERSQKASSDAAAAAAGRDISSSHCADGVTTRNVAAAAAAAAAAETYPAGTSPAHPASAAGR